MENVLFTFLSTVRVVNGEVSATPYNNVNGEPTKTTNESAVRYLLQDDSIGGISKIFIFASKAVRSEIAGYQDENGNTVTHLEFFKRRMKNFMPNVDECITDETIYPYDEDGDGEKNLRSVAEMAERIQNYARGKDIRLYADLTGGMRHINMMMLDVIRLLEYSGVKIEKLLYSNLQTRRVEELNDIYDLFQLISGVEEFVNFGSVKALNKYYANADKFKKSPALQKLTDAMNNFAKSIQLCRYGDFKKAIEKLRDAINDFEVDSQNIHDIFMARLIDKIREKYDLLIATRGEDDLKIIRWCIKHGYLQQALTLYTERVPEYLGKQHFIKQRQDEARKLENALKGDNRKRWFYLLAEYLNNSAEIINLGSEIRKKNSAFNKTYMSMIKNAVTSSIRQGNFTYDEWRQKLVVLVTPPKGFTMEDILPDESTLRVQLELLDKIYKEPQILLDLSADELQPIDGIIYTLRETLESQPKGFNRKIILFKYLGQMTNEDKMTVFPTLKIDGRISRLQYFLEHEIFSLNVPEEKFFSIMKKYFRLKDERNNSNHANAVANFKTADALASFMSAGLDEIEDVEKKYAETLKK